MSEYEHLKNGADSRSKRGKDLRAQRISAARDLRRRGFTYDAIGAEIGVTAMTAANYVIEGGGVGEWVDRPEPNAEDAVRLDELYREHRQKLAGGICTRCRERPIEAEVHAHVLSYAEDRQGAITMTRRVCAGCAGAFWDEIADARGAELEPAEAEVVAA